MGGKVHFGHTAHRYPFADQIAAQKQAPAQLPRMIRKDLRGLFIFGSGRRTDWFHAHGHTFPVWDDGRGQNLAVAPIMCELSAFGSICFTKMSGEPIFSVLMPYLSLASTTGQADLHGAAPLTFRGEKLLAGVSCVWNTGHCSTSKERLCGTVRIPAMDEHGGKECALLMPSHENHPERKQR